MVAVFDRRTGGSGAVPKLGLPRFAGCGEPGYASCDGDAGGEGIGEAIAERAGASDVGDEGGLEETRYTKTGGDKDYAEGGIWTNE